MDVRIDKQQHNSDLEIKNREMEEKCQYSELHDNKMIGITHSK
jgi:hypothetical protein